MHTEPLKIEITIARELLLFSHVLKTFIIYTEKPAIKNKYLFFEINESSKFNKERKGTEWFTIKGKIN